jgi:glycosyltransferase involved in cell wall biosynthesis
MPEIMQNLVSTIIPVYNRPKLLREAVESVLNQTHRPIEIIIVDDGSTDDTPHVADTLVRYYPEVITVLHTSNNGPGLAREAGRQIANGEFIQYLDSDDLLLPRKYEIQIKALRTNPDCGVAYGYTRLLDEKGNILAAPIKWTGRTLPTLFPWLLIDRWWNTHTPLWRKSVCDSIGHWSDMRMSEDWEYDARAGALGTKLFHCKEYVADVRQHSGLRLIGKKINRDILKDVAKLIHTLYWCALKAGVRNDCPEMLHFSRWAFSLARQTGSVGLIEEAKECFHIAKLAAGPQHSKKIDFKLYRVMVHIMGWKLTGLFFCHLDKILKRKPGPLTLKNSWMENLNSN